MSGELAGKVAVVTGGSSGIGLGTAQRFLAEGARVVIADVNRERGEEIAKDLGADAAFKHTDVSAPDQVAEHIRFAIERFDGLHVMFNSAGISGVRHGSLLDDDLSDFHAVMGVNLLGTMVGTREAARHMSKNGGGSIINISSIGGIQPAPSLWSYHTSKASVIMFTKCAAIDLGRFDIRVNCIAPGNIETPILEQTVAGNLGPEERAELMAKVRAFIIAKQPIQRQGNADDIAEAAVYFASDGSSYVTGTLLPVDGGLIAGTPPTSSSGIDALRRAENAD